jgi:hypothetical protein
MKPSIDAVMVWVTGTVERDYAERGVFPNIRSGSNGVSGAGRALYVLEQSDARAVLADAQERARVCSGGTKKSYSTHAKAIEAEIEIASKRETAITSPDAVLTSEDAYRQTWLGTKDSLCNLGLSWDRPWPGEPNAKKRLQFSSSMGWAQILEYSSLWPGLLVAHIRRSGRATEVDLLIETRKKEAMEADADAAREAINALPSNDLDFRQDIAQSIRQWVAFTLEYCEKAKHGYSFAPDSIGAILESLDAVISAISEADVRFNAENRQATLTKYKQAIALADSSFQQHLSGLIVANPQILEGQP